MMKQKCTLAKIASEIAFWLENCFSDFKCFLMIHVNDLKALSGS